MRKLMEKRRKQLLPSIHADSIVFTIRGEKVILDTDLAIRYGVTSKVLNQAVKRNVHRLPPDFLFRLTKPEWTSLKS
jgi:ORF6N domain